jgi:hypothetical protein
MSQIIEPMSSDLLRQRRNLMIFSSILWFLKYSQIEISKFSLFGVEFSHFENPSSVFLVIWICWIYFCIRYYQYFAQEGIPKLLKSITHSIDTKCGPKVQKIVKEKYPTEKSGDFRVSTIRKNDWIYSGLEPKGSNGMGSNHYNKFEMKIPRLTLFPEILKSIISILMNQSVITDYLLPIIMAIAVLIYCFGGWVGGILNIFNY